MDNGLAALALATGASREGWAWGGTGHEWVSGIAIEKLPDSLPDFVRTQVRDIESGKVKLTRDLFGAD